LPIKTDIRTLSKEQLITQLEQLGEKPFRAKQIYEWLWQKSAVDFDDMTNLSKELREKLKAHFVIQSISAYKVQKSNDGTIKSAFQLHDKHIN
jgi:23S rRNA (adenine2503-C2)-methyltransferase